MRPGRLDIKLQAADSYYGPEIALPSLVPFGGPADLSIVGTTVVARIRRRYEVNPVLFFTVEIINASQRRIRLRLSPSQVASAPAKGVWDLQVLNPSLDFAGTILEGTVEVVRRVS